MIRRELLAVVIILAAALWSRAVAADILIGMAGPMPGTNGWVGEQIQLGAALAVADIKTAGGVLGQRVELITVDDFCDPEEAVAPAKKLVSDGVTSWLGIIAPTPRSRHQQSTRRQGS